MFDQMTHEAAYWADDVQRGDIVLFKFPVRHPGLGDEPKVRPCLVLEVEMHGDHKRLVLAYGTSAATPANRGYEIAITHVSDLQAAGLKRATRFVGARLLSVSPDHTGFDVGGTEPPIIGRLPANRIERMNWVRARIHAERDIAADRRAERRKVGPVVEPRRRHFALTGKPAA